MKILDLYAGIGGTAKGIHLALKEAKIKHNYVAVECNLGIARIHKENNPKSIVIEESVQSFLKRIGKTIYDFSFIWASPPCETHSKCMLFWYGKEQFRKPSNELWELITTLRQIDIPFVVENVIPYYRPPFRPTVKIDRHYFWSNFPLESFETKNCPYELWERVGQKYWENFHGLKAIDTKSARSAVYYEISKGIFEQFLNPIQYELTDFLEGVEQKT